MIPVQERAIAPGLTDAEMIARKLWFIPGTEDLPFVKPWKTDLVKRSLAMPV